MMRWGRVCVSLTFLNLRYTNADLKICQYLCLHIKIVSWRFHIKAPLLFEICAREICEKFVYKDSEAIEPVKN